MNLSKKILVAAVAASLAACAGMPERNVPDDVRGMLPEQFTEVGSEADAQVPLEWWREFNDPQLDRLVEQGLQYNSDLIIAAQRLRQARAALSAARAGQLPEVGVFIDGARQRAVVPGTATTAITESAGYGASVRYEVDLWGRLAAASEAERQRYLSQGYTLASLRLSIAAELVRGYLQASALMESRNVLAENVEVLEDQLRLSQRRFEIGTISELDLQRFRSELEDSRAQLAEVTQQQQAVQRALLVLAGQLPSNQALSQLTATPYDQAPAALPVVPTGLPAQLLDRRPDLRAAESNLAAAGADLSAARRAWFPNVVITGQAGQVSTSLSDLFDDGLDVWSISANVLQAIFDGGRRNAAIESNRAQREAVAETYRNSIRLAFAEVLDALDARTFSSQVYDARAAQAEALQTALRLAQRRYDEGYSDYLGVLDARRSLLQSRLAVADARRSAGAAYVDLVLAVGGGWTQE